MAVSAQTAADIRARAVRYRPLAISLVRREVRQRYKGSAFGLLWVFVAFLQAFVCTLLSALFIGMALHPDH